MVKCWNSEIVCFYTCTGFWRNLGCFGSSNITRFLLLINCITMGWAGWLIPLLDMICIPHVVVATYRKVTKSYVNTNLIQETQFKRSELWSEYWDCSNRSENMIKKKFVCKKLSRWKNMKAYHHWEAFHNFVLTHPKMNSPFEHASLIGNKTRKSCNVNIF